MEKKRCDYCGEEHILYDLERVPTYKGKSKWICYKCRSKGSTEVKKLKVAGMEKKGLIGD